MSEIILITVAVFLSIAVVGSWFIIYQIIKQQGRILLHLDEVEHRLMQLSREGLTVKSGSNGNDAQALPRGLPVGTAVSPFRLPNLKGQMVALEDFRGRQVLLVNWNPQCGFCTRIAAELARLTSDFRERNIELLFVSHGDREANQKLAEEYRLESPILLLAEQSLDAFAGIGTPAAYLLNEEGQVARPLAIGADQVPLLANEMATGPYKQNQLPSEKQRSGSLIERNGRKTLKMTKGIEEALAHRGLANDKEKRHESLIR